MQSQKQDTLSFEIERGSFRDPAGFTFEHNNQLYRAISPSYFTHYNKLYTSGLYQELTSHSLMVQHRDKTNFLPAPFREYKIIHPELIPFISYPYEWCFSQLKDAALLTLSIQTRALKYGMTLKDASAFNVQFAGNKPIFIDTLSFEKYEEGTPWIAYRQFCQHFLAPLALIAYKGEGLSKLSQVFLDGIPLELTSSLLTRRSYLNSGIASHLHVHSKIGQRAAKNKNGDKKIMLPKKQLINIVEHLSNTVNGLKLKSSKSQWSKYISENLYSKNAKEEKSKIVANWLRSIKPKAIWDIGCNTGSYSMLASEFCDQLIAIDADYLSIEVLYHAVAKSKNKNILPLMIDLANPTPGIGWDNQERKTLRQRGKPDVLMALALVHHLRISHNIPLEKIVQLFSQLSEWLIIEYVPKNDVQVQEMMMSRKDIFDDYSQPGFISTFESFFEIKGFVKIVDSERIVYLMKRIEK